MVCISGHQHPRFEIKYGGAHKTRPVDVISAEEFIAVKGVKAKGKRLTAFVVANISELEPLIPDEEFVEAIENADNVEDFNIGDDTGEDPPQMTLEM